ncbi:TonB-dependent receptor [Fulvivirga sp. RKSG066]|uniref:TonB-dependent receptor n=1 Tax=Fulvivirga aurantia TaxID=2529383 RepID=UPI0012BBA69D|nr:TonB-dependent receptor [Fulvivirga aurantia]MTI23310.1 TonB-dependent receptor [Fulvivirga aurantia]
MKTLLTLLILFPSLALAQSTISGTVTSDKGEPIPGANVFLDGTYDGTSTDINGQFNFSTEEEGNHKLIVAFIGYTKETIAVTLPQNLSYNFSLKEEINRLDAVVISAGSFSAGEESNREVLKPLDIVTTAGATADIAGALNTLPGTQTVGETGRLFVRGGEGYETRTFIDGMEVLNSYAPSAPNTPGRARFSPFMFSGTSFSTGGYSAEYGQALSSALILNTKEIAEVDRTDISLMTVGADISHSQSFEKSSISGKIQYTNLTPYFELVKQKINFEKAPESFDGNMAYRHKVGDDGLLKVYGNFNKTDFVIYRPQIFDEELEDKVDLSNSYGHLNTTYKDILSDQWSLKTGFSITNSEESIVINNQPYDEKTRGAHTKAVLSYDTQSQFSLSFGGEHFYRNSQFDVNQEGAPEFSYNQHIGSAFAEADIYLSNDFVLRTGLRAEHESLSKKYIVTPRLSLAHKLGEKGQVSLAYGKFNQQAQPDYLRVNNNLQSEKAEHYILNYQYLTGKRTFRIEGYYKKYSDLVKFQDAYDQASFSNLGSGFAKGFDVFWRDAQTFTGLDYWVSYSYIDTERDYQDFPTTATPAFSSKHNFSFVTKYFVQSLKTQIGTTYSFGSSRPYNDPNQEGFNTERTPAYHDLSVNFSYLYRSNVIIHASITNVLGVDNIFGYEYSDQQNDQGQFVGRAIKQQAPRFIFLGAFITLSKNKVANQMPNL